MRKATLLIALILFVCSQVMNAQMRMSHEDRVKQYTERLKLTDDQIKKVDTILTRSEKKMQAITTEDRTERRAQMMKMMDESNAQIEKILTTDQKTELKKMIEERKNRMQGQRPNQ